MTGNIFLIHDDDTLVPMNESAYDTEGMLQGLLAKYPDLLAGDQMESSDPRRWLLVRREIGIPGEEEGGDRWSLDHLFLDQDGVPTLVEVKRSTDTRIRREVVGQMLDYAANAVAYWPVEKIRAGFEAECETSGTDPDELISNLTDGGLEVDDFWQRVKTNLQAGRIRMLFVADEIPSELRRIIEFLNTQMDPAQVLGVEVKQFVGENMKSLVPRVVGQTEEAKGKKGGGPKRLKESDEVRRKKCIEYLQQNRGQRFGAGAFGKNVGVPKAVVFRLLDGVDGIRITEEKGQRLYEAE